MNKELSKIIMNKSRIKNKYLKWPSKENYLACKKITSKCNNLVKNLRKGIFKKMLVKVLHQVNLYGTQSRNLVKL